MCLLSTHAASTTWFNTIKEKRDEHVNKVVLRLRLPVEQRMDINRVQMHLQLMLVSDLLTHKKNTIKAAQRDGLFDESCTSNCLTSFDSKQKRHMLLEEIYL